METKNEYGIEVGTPATFGCWTDRYPGVVVRVTPKKVVVREVEHGPNKVTWPDQDFPIYLDKPVGKEMMFTRTKRGWRSKGYSASFGTARFYQDPSF